MSWWQYSGYAGTIWPWLSAVSTKTNTIKIGNSVTPSSLSYNPAIVAQVFIGIHCFQVE